jgi:hypothetical protein
VQVHHPLGSDTKLDYTCASLWITSALTAIDASPAGTAVAFTCSGTALRGREDRADGARVGSGEDTGRKGLTARGSRQGLTTSP